MTTVESGKTHQRRSSQNKRRGCCRKDEDLHWMVFCFIVSQKLFCAIYLVETSITFQSNQ